MALVTFQDLPSTSTPLNAANLNNNFDEVKASATAYITENTTTSSTASTIQKVVLTSINSNSNSLTLSNGGIKIGSGISKVLISGAIRYYALANSALGERRLQIVKNSTAIARTFGYRPTSDVRYISLGIEPIQIDVNENDILYLYSYSSQPSEEISSSAINETRLTVEVK